MKRFIFPLIAIICLIGLFSTACFGAAYIGSGSIVTQTYDFKDFTEVEISNSMEYEITQSGTYSVSVSTHENLVDRLDISQSGKTLIVRLKPGSYTHADTKATITMPGLNQLSVSGVSKGSAKGFQSSDDLDIVVSGVSRLDIQATAGNTTFEVNGSSTTTGTLQAQNLDLNVSGASHCETNISSSTADFNISGASKMKGALNTQNLTLNISGASRCEANGAATTSNIEISGASHLVAPNFKMQDTDIELSGASGAEIYSSGKLNIKATGASSLDYSGNPDVKLIEVSGASRVATE